MMGNLNAGLSYLITTVKCIEFWGTTPGGYSGKQIDWGVASLGFLTWA